MGASDLIPGISGGTIALITGIYKELLESINALSLKNLKKIIINNENFWKDINGPFLLPLFSGITISKAICFAHDHSCAYFTDTPTKQIMRQPLDKEGWPTGAATVLVDLTSSTTLSSSLKYVG